MELSAIHELIGKDLAGELLPEEQAVLTAWLAQATATEKLTYEAIRHYWTLPVRPVATAAETAAALEALLPRLPDAGSTPPVPEEARIIPFAPATPWWRGRAAAAVAGVAVVGGALVYGVMQQLSNEAGVPPSYTEYVTPRGATAKVLLADGTAVWLNADSHLWYPKKFGGQQREVYLQGEAYFDVMPSRQQPFTVHVGRQQVRVLGTSFNVQAYPEEPTVETAVVTGRVAFIRAGAGGAATSQDTLYVTPNQQAVFVKRTAALRRQPANSQDVTAWNRGELVFEQTPLDEVARTLARQYNTSVVLENEALRTCRLTGRFQHQSLPEVVRLLALTGSFGFELSPKQLRITGPGCR
ncbi:FecR family protein [Hymenobacter metallilatus]|nr:FecR domain-containing protein [Hymenobacter metallilatus]